MSSDAIGNFPTFVDVNSSHMASSDHPMSITVYVDQPANGINDDSDSHSPENLQKDLVKCLPPGEENDVEIYDGDASGLEDNTHVWVKEEVELLFKLYKERLKEINDPQRKKREVWVDICAELRRYGFNPTPKQCDRKLRNMKATYIKTLERIKRGDNFSTCQYYDELYDIYGLNPPLQTPPRFLVQQRNRPVPPAKNEYVNGHVNIGTNSLGASYEPAAKRAVPHPNQKGSPIHKHEPGLEFTNHPTSMQVPRLPDQSMMAMERQQHPDQKALAEMTEEVKMFKKALESEKEAREIERKSFEEERKDFHKERMTMLSSINKLIGNLDQKNS